MQRLFNQAGYTTERKNVPHSRGMKKANLHVKDFRLEGIQDVIIDVTLQDEFHGSCIYPAHNGEASYADPNGAIDAAVKAKLDNYQHDYSERNFFFLPAVMTTSGRISGDFLRLLSTFALTAAAIAPLGSAYDASPLRAGSMHEPLNSPRSVTSMT